MWNKIKTFLLTKIESFISDKIKLYFYNTIIPFVQQYWIGFAAATLGLSITGDIADVVIVTKIIGIISAFLIVSSMILSDKAGKGVFPHYNEEELISIAKQSPLASAMIIIVKNVFVITLIILAVLFIRP